MRFTKQRLSKIADHGRRLLALESAIQRSAAVLNLAALAGAVYLIIPVAGHTRANVALEQIWVLAVLGIFLAINFVQYLVMIRMRKQWMQLEKLSIYDNLTNAFNRACFEDILQEEMRRSGRYHFPLTLCVIDLDNFKSYNDSFGHGRGDELLKRFARHVLGAIRSTDCFARYGGDEFCILLPHTDTVRAEKFLSRLLINVQEWVDTSFSAGVTSFRTGETKAQFVMRADLALYQAKKEGKNRIRCVIGKDDSPVVLNF